MLLSLETRANSALHVANFVGKPLGKLLKVIPRLLSSSLLTRLRFLSCDTEPATDYATISSSLFPCRMGDQVLQTCMTSSVSPKSKLGDHSKFVRITVLVSEGDS